MPKPLTENKMAVFNILSTVLVAGINFFTIPIFTRMLDTAGYGVVSVYNAWVQISTVVIGLRVDGTIGAASANLKEEEQGPYQFSVSVLAVVVFVSLFVISLVFLQPLSALLGMESLLVVCMMFQSVGSLMITIMNMRFIFCKQAQMNFAMSVGLCSATSILSVALIFFVFSGDTSYYGRVLGLAVPNLMLGLMSFLTLFKRYASSFSFRFWRFCLPLALPLIFHGLSQLVLAQTGKIIIQQQCGDSMAGIYSIAVTIVMLLNAIYGALNNAFVPFMYDDLSGKTSEEVKQRHFKNYMTLFTLGVCAFAFVSPEILKLLSTKEYWIAVSLLPPLVFGQYCVFLYSFPVNYEFYSLKTRSIAVGTSFAAILNIGLSLLLVPLIGMMGAAVATMGSYLVLFLFHFSVARYSLGDRNYPLRAFVVGLAIVALVCVLCYPLDAYPVVRWIVGVTLLAVALGRAIKRKAIF